MAAGLCQTDVARAVPCHRTTVAHAEAGSHFPDAQFWETADRVVGAHIALVARYDAFIQAKAAHAAKLQQQRRMQADMIAQRLHMTPRPQGSASVAVLTTWTAP